MIDDNDSAPETPARMAAFYGRRKGKPLRKGQTEVVETLLPGLSIDLAVPAPADLKALFAADIDDVWMESGFGGGEHLLNLAESHPRIGFIGAEPFVNGMAKLLAILGQRPDLAARIRLHAADAVPLLDWLPEASLGRFYLLYPDPWPKTRHWKRRFVGADNIARLARVLRPGAEFRFASDWSPYVDWTLQRVPPDVRFRWLAETSMDWKEPWAGWPGTRYEAKAVREGRVPAYLRFGRV
ncbi:MAG: tRNA (guanine(46)-N(7))-methyltransferase TrmB [Ancalomicrobiaceae bacterium]|nr:tRNA (guanine(46)-N(7))-methyltransferase TrmB [Ancalomicrobiaceae bacterium]